MSSTASNPFAAPPSPSYVDAQLVDPAPVQAGQNSAPNVAASNTAPIEAIAIVEDVRVVDERNWFVKVWQFCGSVLEWLFGSFALILGLSILATVPLTQMLSLGYLLEASGRIGRTGKLRHGFVGVRTAARVGSIVVGTWLWLWPLRFAATMVSSANLIDPQSPAARGWSIALSFLTVAIVGHLLTAYWRGGRLRSFFWPANPFRMAREWFDRRAYARARDAVCDFVARLRLPYYFWLGCRGFAGGFVWLVFPITLLAVAPRLGGLGGLMGLFGAMVLMVVLMYLPFLQARFAAENRFGVFFEPLQAHRMFRRAPIACWISVLIALLFAVPLYVLKIEIVPREAAWLPSLLFVTFGFPARLLSGWAYGRAVRRPTPRFILFRWASWWAMLPVTGFYVLIVFFTQYTSWHGALSLYEQHAFLVPVPFLGL